MSDKRLALSVIGVVVLAIALITNCSNEGSPPPEGYPKPYLEVTWVQPEPVGEHYDLHIRSYQDGENTPGHSWLSARDNHTGDFVSVIILSDTALVGEYKLIVTAVRGEKEATSDHIVINCDDVKGFYLKGEKIR